jgi:hypothetical protein
MKTGYYVTMQQGSPYFITGDGQIIRTDMPFDPSDSWVAIGIYSSRLSYIGQWVDFAPRASDLKSFNRAGTDFPFTFTFKNGKSLYFIGDIYHGTMRIQGDGILNIQRASFERQPNGFWNFAKSEQPAS